MRIFIAIQLMILILLSGISVKIATHYCGGNIAATKVSLSGELASCGMEIQVKGISDQDIFSSNCCDDITSVYSINNNYIPSYCFNLIVVQELNFSIPVPVNYRYNQMAIINNSNIVLRPPGSNYPNNVTLPDICLLRI